MSSDFSFVVDQTDQATWQEWLASFPDAGVYQSWDYGRLHSQGLMRTVSRCALIENQRPVAMAQLRVKRLEPVVPGVAECDYGPVWGCRGAGHRAEVLAEMLARMQQEYCVKRGLQLRVRPQSSLDPVGDESVAAVFEASGYTRNPSVRAYHTTAVDVTQSVEALRKALHQKWRNQLNTAEKAMLTSERGTSLELFDRFLEVYKRMWAHKRFPTGVRLPVIRDFQAAAPESEKFQILVVSEEAGRERYDVGATVCAAVGDTMLYFLGATAPEVRSGSRPGYLMQWLHILWAKENGFHWYDAGGYNAEASEDIARFKQRMGGQQIIFPGQYEATPNLAAMKRYELLERAFRSVRYGLTGR